MQGLQISLSLLSQIDYFPKKCSIMFQHVGSLHNTMYEVAKYIPMTREVYIQYELFVSFVNPDVSLGHYSRAWDKNGTFS